MGLIPKSQSPLIGVDISSGRTLWSLPQAGGAHDVAFVARIEVAIPGTNPKKYVYITPEGLWDRGNKMPAALLTMNAISSSATHGAFMLTWNDQLFGGDYDMDIAGYLRYDIVARSGTAIGYAIRITTDIVNVGAGATGSHGYSVIGTNRDGLYLTHRNLTSDTNLRTTPGYLCSVTAYTGATNLSTVAIPANGVFPGIPAGKITGRGDGRRRFPRDDPLRERQPQRPRHRRHSAPHS